MHGEHLIFKQFYSESFKNTGVPIFMEYYLLFIFVFFKIYFYSRCITLYVIGVQCSDLQFLKVTPHL